MNTVPRSYLSDGFSSGAGWHVVESSAGRIAVHPIKASSVYFDAARSNHKPAMRNEGEHGSTVIEIGRGIVARLSGNVERTADGWTCTHLSASHAHGGDLTRAQEDRARELVATMIVEWIADHETELQRADEIYRNNAARTIEENMARHEDALRILRRNRRACDAGKAYETYPDLPTKGR